MYTLHGEDRGTQLPLQLAPSRQAVPCDLASAASADPVTHTCPPVSGFWTCTVPTPWLLSKGPLLAPVIDTET